MSDGFTGFQLGRSVLRGIAAAGFVDPRPIQVQTIPAALAGRDILGLAQTGTGKTAAFALPLLERLLATRRPGPRVLIVAPTRELASQITDEIRTLGQFTPIRAVPIFGGVSMHSQINALRAKPEIIVACPGRLLDLMRQGVVQLDHIETLVLDEADHMFDMGFLPDVRRILEALPAKRQNMLFSATMPREIRRLANRQLRDPHVVEIDHTRPIAAIEHALYPIGDKQKLALLEHLIQADAIALAIVFTRTKHRARRVAQQLSRSGHRAVALQGNMSQNARVRAMDGFRKREFDILVATDIAARGIDVEQVSHVVNFDMPGTVEAYTHRIGRTGRAERDGKAYTFVTADDSPLVRAVEQRIGSAIPRRTVDGFEGIPFSMDRSNGRRPAPRNAKPRNSSPRPKRRQRSRSQGRESSVKGRVGFAAASTSRRRAG